MVTNKVQVIFQEHSHTFNLQNIHSLHALEANIIRRFGIAYTPFVLKQSLEHRDVLDERLFNTLRDQGDQFTVYVVEWNDEVQKSLSRLNLGENNENSQEFQISFDQKRSEQRSEGYHDEPIKKVEADQREYMLQKKKSIKNANTEIQDLAKQLSQIDMKVQCDICFIFPIKGHIFKCLVCNEFDLCSQCERHYHHFHPLLQITKKQHYPTEISVLFQKRQEEYMQLKLQEQRETIKEVKKVMYGKDGEESRYREIDPFEFEIEGGEKSKLRGLPIGFNELILISSSQLTFYVYALLQWC